jgi:hypothetical protein
LVSKPFDERGEGVDRVGADDVGRDAPSLTMPVEFVDDLVDRRDERVRRRENVDGVRPGTA